MAEFSTTIVLIAALASFILARLSPLVRKGADLFDPIYGASAYFLLLFVIRTIADVFVGSEFINKPPWDHATALAINLGLLYCIFAYAAFVIGYQLEIGAFLANSGKRFPEFWSEQRCRIFLPVMLTTGLLFYVILIQYLGGLSFYLTHKQQTLTAGGQTYLSAGVALLLMVFTVSLSRAFTGRKGKVVAGGLFVLLLSMAIFSGSAGNLLTPLIVLAVTFHYLRKRLSVKTLVAIFLLGILIRPIFGIYRYTSDTTQIFDAAQKIGTGKSAEIFVRDAVDRFYGIDSLAYIIRDTPRVMDFQYGATIAPAFVAWIPRQLWPDKPTISFGKVFTTTYFRDIDIGEGTSASVTILGEAYLNWHLAGMLWIAFIWGVVLRACYEYLIRRHFGLPAVFIYASLYPSILSFWEFDIAGYLAAKLVFLVQLLLVVWLLSRRTNEQMGRLPAPVGSQA
jgi:oligosaccharide repeat unit polymerase